MKHFKIISVLLAFSALLIAPLCALATPEVTQMSPWGIYQEAMNPAGEYVIYVLKEDEWKEVGKLSFDKYFRSREVDLDRYVSGDESVRVRLVQNGGGAAHVDAVLLGDRAPAEVKGVEDVLALKKVSKKDFDVVDAFQKSIEFVFPSGGTNKVLILTARVEETRISETPFQFPLGNLYKEMTGNSGFYRYRLLSEGNGPRTTDRPDMSREPFFKEYSVTGSGHPSGFTYGWVRNDNENLYVTMDFTPDDTMDGDKDYAKVYVKTKGGVRGFKVSVSDTRWGRPDFTYTPRVTYQHKVYDFRIPFKEIGIVDATKEKELLLAFAAYGTASPPYPWCYCYFPGGNCGTNPVIEGDIPHYLFRCFPPQELVRQWIRDLPGLYVEPYGEDWGVYDRDGESSSPSDIQADCQEACKKWVEGCKGNADAGKECLNKINESYKKFIKDGECKTYENPTALKNCQTDADDKVKSFQNFTNCVINPIKTCCEDLLPICQQICEEQSGLSDSVSIVWPQSCSSINIDQPFHCGNGICEPSENSFDCPDDCTPECGNGVCENGEDINNCPGDCD